MGWDIRSIATARERRLELMALSPEKRQALTWDDVDRVVARDTIEIAIAYGVRAKVVANGGSAEDFLVALSEALQDQG